MSDDDPEQHAGRAADTLADGSPSSESEVATMPGGRRSSLPPRHARPELPARYELLTRIGEGGMGEVLACLDRRIGREVALKLVRTDRHGEELLRMRFEREARVQGRLEHPSIVPVYDLERTADGTPYFTMKRVRGRTLEQILDGLRARDPQTERDYPRRRLLSALAAACNALALAHTRGVLHRDLKPANVMLGDFGEVYVLDWGLAKILGESEDDRRAGNTGNSSEGSTTVGTVLGTPGYMSPEQALGDLASLGPTTDVYALGAILFEVLTLLPLHDAGSAAEILASTARGADARASVRAPDADVPPELDAVCEAATRFHPRDRMRTARELHEALERFLGGDRDVARRRELAAEHAGRAEQLLATDRELAMQEATRAVALDPTSGGATRVLARLLLEPPKEIPEEAREAFAQSTMAARTRAAKSSVWSYLAWIVAGLGPLAMGVREPFLLAFALGSGALACAILAWMGHRGQVETRFAGLVLLFSLLGVIAASTLFGPFVMVPGMAAANTAMFAIQAERKRERATAIVLGTLAILVPIVLEVTHLLPRSIEIRDGALVILPRMADFTPLPTMAFLAATSLALVVVPPLMISQVRDAAVRAERRAFLHAWQLERLLPREARRVAR